MNHSSIVSVSQSVHLPEGDLSERGYTIQAVECTFNEEQVALFERMFGLFGKVIAGIPEKHRNASDHLQVTMSVPITICLEDRFGNFDDENYMGNVLFKINIDGVLEANIDSSTALDFPPMIATMDRIADLRACLQTIQKDKAPSL